jgi:hypothetical protein
MLKNIAKLEYTIGTRSYQLLCDSDSPTNELKEALCQFMKFVGYVEDQAAAKQQASQQEENTTTEGIDGEEES